MLALLLLTAVGGFAWGERGVADRARPVPAAPDGGAATWHERGRVVVPADPRDAALARLPAGRTGSLARDCHAGPSGADAGSFETRRTAGSPDVAATVGWAALGPDLRRRPLPFAVAALRAVPARRAAR